MFESHKLNREGLMDVELFKSTMAKATNLALMMMPEGRAKSEFKTCIETGVFWGAKALAEKTGNFTEVIDYPKDV